MTKNKYSKYLAFQHQTQK